MDNLISIIESVLFVSGNPVGIKRLAKITGAKEAEVKAAVDELGIKYKNNNHGLRIIKKEGEVQIGSAPEFKDYVNKLVKSDLEDDLSRASLEVLAVIAYRGPISRLQIEEIRGVNCSFTIRNLLLRGLIERVENPGDSRSYLYKISFDFLKHLGLEGIEQLPGYGELRNKGEKESDMPDSGITKE